MLVGGMREIHWGLRVDLTSILWRIYERWFFESLKHAKQVLNNFEWTKICSFQGPKINFWIHRIFLHVSYIYDSQPKWILQKIEVKSTLRLDRSEYQVTTYQILISNYLIQYPAQNYFIILKALWTWVHMAGK